MHLIKKCKTIAESLLTKSYTQVAIDSSARLQIVTTMMDTISRLVDELELDLNVVYR